MASFEGKGSWIRPTQVSKEEKSLRNELFWDKPNNDRKAEIIKRLSEIVEEAKSK